MKDETRLTQIRTVSRGFVKPIQGGESSREMSFKQALEKWNHANEQVKDLPWSQVPDGMLRDFLTAVAGDIEASYGDHAQRKAMEIVTITLAKKGLTQAKLGCGWPQSGARFDLDMQVRPIGEKSPPAEVGMEFTLEGPQASESEVRQALGAIGKAKGENRLILDPVAMVPEQELRRLLADIESLVGQDSDVSALLVGASVLLIWEQMEKFNAQTTESTMAGMHSGDEVILEGMEVVLTGFRVALDRTHQLDAEQAPAVQVSTVRLPKH